MPGRRDCLFTGRGRIHHRDKHHDLRPPRGLLPCGHAATAPQRAGAAAASAACRRSARPARPRRPATTFRPSTPVADIARCAIVAPSLRAPSDGALPPSTTAGGAAAFSARTVTGCERGHRSCVLDVPELGCRAGLAGGEGGGLDLAGKSGEPISVLPTYRYLKGQQLSRHGEKREKQLCRKTTTEQRPASAKGVLSAEAARGTWRPGRAQSGS
jgi:hypothetical protein